MKTIYSILVLVFLVSSVHGEIKESNLPLISTVLNNDGTVQTGRNGNYDVRGFDMGYTESGAPFFKTNNNSDAASVQEIEMSSNVLCLAIVGTDLYAGGQFTSTTSGIEANYIARWDGSIWSALGNGAGLSGAVRTIVVGPNNDLYVGGDFLYADGILVNRMALWDGANWSGFGSGVNHLVRTLVLDANNNLYAGGQFTMTGGSYVAMYNASTETWSPVGLGLNDEVISLAVDANNILYAGGRFSLPGGAYVAKFNASTSTWEPLGLGVNNVVNVLVVHGNDLYAGGYFSNAGCISANLIAKWGITTGIWSALGPGLTPIGNTSSVIALSIGANNDIYVGGNFGFAGPLLTTRVAKWSISSSTWSKIGTRGQAVFAMAAYGANSAFAGGQFPNRIARWDGTSWILF